ncbi:DUF3299 domain-containing protein [Piscinibacter sakaiensis]|uniref:DUF3299 domain-containing protein n=1 Tax=Piscinibacter sakaiensis TaxID=1547922 RepID=UPI003728E362
MRALPPDVDTLQDGDPRARAALEQLRAAWDRAPAVPELAGAALRLPGYVVPLKGSKAGLIDFLLVPYLGACVHSPPPPANQVVRCRSARPLPGIRLMEAVWASGRLALERSASPMGTAAYALRIDAVVRQG